MTMPAPRIDAREGADPSKAVAVSDCPLCGDVLAADELRAHVQAETEELRGYVLSVIRTNHPEWIESDGSCVKCWENYRNL